MGKASSLCLSIPIQRASHFFFLVGGKADFTLTMDLGFLFPPTSIVWLKATPKSAKVKRKRKRKPK